MRSFLGMAARTRFWRSGAIVTPELSQRLGKIAP